MSNDDVVYGSLEDVFGFGVEYAGLPNLKGFSILRLFS